MKTRTFTLLVTITDDNVPADPKELGRDIAHMLETGKPPSRIHRVPYVAATVSALAGDQLTLDLSTVDVRNLHHYLRVKALTSN